MFVLIFANFNFECYLATPLGDCLMFSAEVHTRAQAVCGNITVMSHHQWFVVVFVLRGRQQFCAFSSTYTLMD